MICVKTILLIELFFVLTGCTSSRVVAPHSGLARADTLDITEVQQGIRKKEIQLVLVNEQIVGGSDPIIRNDSLHLLHDEGTIGVPLDSIRSIEWKDHVSPLVGGLFMGALGGGVAGWAVGSWTSHGDMAGLGKALSIVTGAGLGAVTGALIGGISGRSVMYRFPQAREGKKQASAQ